VEVVLALSLFTFAIVVITALLPIGIASNKASSKETQGAALLTLLETDLRNTYPGANSGKSQIFGLILPYKVVSGKMVLNDSSAIQVNTLSAADSTGVNSNETPISYTTVPPPPFQVSVIYTRLPAAGTESPLEARLIVNWPAVNAIAVSQLTANGFLESYVTFPPP
jgi:hypothetical protein